MRERKPMTSQTNSPDSSKIEREYETRVRIAESFMESLFICKGGNYGYQEAIADTLDDITTPIHKNSNDRLSQLTTIYHLLSHMPGLLHKESDSHHALIRWVKLQEDSFSKYMQNLISDDEKNLRLSLTSKTMELLMRPHKFRSSLFYQMLVSFILEDAPLQSCERLLKSLNSMDIELQKRNAEEDEAAQALLRFKDYLNGLKTRIMQAEVNSKDEAQLSGADHVQLVQTTAMKGQINNEL